MKFLDLFAGIGGFRLGLEQAGHECVGFCEINKFARQSYKAIHNTEGEREYHDITTVSNEEWRTLRGTVELICGGFPCQAFSIAGKRKGFLDETRGTLFFEIARAAEQIKPRTLFLENVRGLLSHDKGRTFRTIISTLNELGYDAEWQILNSKNFGVPQNRERVFIIGHLRGERGREVFPIGESNIEINDGFKIKIVGNTNNAGNGQKSAVYSADGIMGCLTATDYKQPKQIAIPVLTPDRAEKRQNGRRFKEDGDPKFTLTAQDRHGVAVKEATKKGFAIANLGDSINLSVPNSKTRRGRVGKQVAQTLDTSCNQATITKDTRIRKLTPRECWRLQGFPDWAFNKAQEVNSNSQLYKQAGNSVTVPVIYEIARRFE